jgi:uncharacterized membrane protein
LRYIRKKRHPGEHNVDCYFHSNVPSVAPCADCGKPICATCRDEAGTCPSCRLAAKIDNSAATRRAVAGDVPPRSQQFWRGAPQQPAPQPRATVAEPLDPAESRALVALGYPLWPLALLALFDRKQSRRLRKHAYQALGFNLGMGAIGTILYFLTTIPFINWTPLGWSSDILAAVLIPIWMVLSVYWGIKAWHGDDVHVPIVSDWLSEKNVA